MGILKNRTIVITGASRGIGLEIAKACAGEGAQVVMISRNRKNLEAAVKAIEKNHQGHRIIKMDVGNGQEVEGGARMIAKEMGAIHGLVNCAGIIGAIGRIDDIDPRKFADTIQTNLLGTFLMCHHFIPLLLKSGNGKIVNFSGGGATAPLPNYSAYAVSKVGIVKLTENLAVEFRTFALDINAVSPGFVATGIHQETIAAGKKAGEDYLRKTIERLENGGVSPGIPAALTVFLLSSKSDGISGKLISACWDPWEETDFQERLRQESNFATLRRIDGRFFFERD
jgi:NAD(P)-dependent dehydrogenase (short-subunit alcohol dehydrogenase family)